MLITLKMSEKKEARNKKVYCGHCFKQIKSNSACNFGRKQFCRQYCVEQYKKTCPYCKPREFAVYVYENEYMCRNLHSWWVCTRSNHILIVHPRNHAECKYNYP